MAQQKISLVVTSIAPPQKVLKALADGSSSNNIEFIVIGDVPSPKDFKLDGCDFYGLERQKELPFSFAKDCPLRHYSRKNIGYLQAIKNGAEIIIETDDDNIPREGFWKERTRKVAAKSVTETGWINIYRYFSESNIWPRGFPLELLQQPSPTISADVKILDCPIQQGLADENPDVDAIYRLVLTLPQNFNPARIALGNNAWCPFNSQNTTFFKEAFPLLYLPSYCSFRMTDIWRSFVAQKIAWVNGWNILFHESTVYQERNDHNLLKDFIDEIPGYVNNAKMCAELDKLDMRTGVEHIGSNMIKAYTKFVEMNLVDAKELPLLDAWLSDLRG